MNAVDKVISRGKLGPTGGFKRTAMVLAGGRTRHLVEQSHGKWVDSSGNVWSLGGNAA
jgi:hypothetical protein